MIPGSHGRCSVRSVVLTSSSDMSVLRFLGVQLGVVVAFLIPSSYSFFIGIRTPHAVSAFHSRTKIGTFRSSHDERIATLAMSSSGDMESRGQGMDAGASAGGGLGKRAKEGMGKPKKGSLIPGPPRLESISPDKLDEMLLFREERPNT